MIAWDVSAGVVVLTRPQMRLIIERIALATLLASCGGAGGTGAGTRSAETQAARADDARASESGANAQGPGSEGEAGASIAQLVEDLAAEMLCERLEGQFLGLPGGGDEDDATAVAQGRLWIRGCSASVRDRALHAELDALLWTWIDRSTSAVGATFELSQYVVLEARISMTAQVELAYDRPESLAYLFVLPTEPPEVDVDVVSQIQVDEQGLWSEVVGTVATVFSESPSARARARVRQGGRERIEGALASGVTVAVDLCVGQPRTALDRLELGELPGPAVEPGTPTWLDSQRVRLRVMGIDVAGPYDPGARPVVARVHVTDGSPVVARLVCEETAHRMMRGWLAGSLDAVPDVDALAEARVEQGEQRTIEAQAECEMALVTTPVPDARAASVVELVVRGVPANPRELVATCDSRE